MKSTLMATAATAAIAGILATAPPARATELYDNGPIGGVNAANIGGQAVTDSFTLVSAATVTAVDYGQWVPPGELPVSVQWAITTAPFGGTTKGSGTAAVSSTFWGSALGFNIYQASFSIPNVNLGAGGYWLELQSAVTTVAGDTNSYWDENSGASLAFQDSADNQIFSESFAVFGATTVAEPASMALLGSGLLGMAALRRRKAR